MGFAISPRRRDGLTGTVRLAGAVHLAVPLSCGRRAGGWAARGPGYVIRCVGGGGGPNGEAVTAAAAVVFWSDSGGVHLVV